MKVIRGKSALVTGAASGIGRAISLALAGRGATLHVLDCNAVALESTAEQCLSAGASEVHPIVCDLSEPTNVRDVAQRLLREHRGVDILVNNAGIVYYGPTANMKAADRDRLLAVNLHAPIQLTTELLPSLLERYEAHVVNISSMYGLIATPKCAVYHATKFGLIGFTESLRRECSRQGLGVSTICPGMIRTNLFQSGTSGYDHRAVPEPPSFICGTAEQVAVKTMRAIERDERLTLVTATAFAVSYLQRMAPWLPDALYRFGRRRKMRIKQRELEQGLAPTPVAAPSLGAMPESVSPASICVEPRTPSLVSATSTD